MFTGTEYSPRSSRDDWRRRSLDEVTRRTAVAHWRGVRRQAMVEKRLGASVPAAEPDFSCCASWFGGEMPCKGRARPRRRVCFLSTPTEPSFWHCGSRTRETSYAWQGTFIPTGQHSQAFKEALLEIQGLSTDDYRRDTEKTTQRQTRRARRGRSSGISISVASVRAVAAGRTAGLRSFPHRRGPALRISHFPAAPSSGELAPPEDRRFGPKKFT